LLLSLWLSLWLRARLSLRLLLHSRLRLRLRLGLRLRHLHGWSASLHLRSWLLLRHRLLSRSRHYRRLTLLLRHGLRSRSRHYPRLTLLSLNLNLRLALRLWLRLNGLRVRRMTNHRRLTPLNLRRSRFTLVLNSRRLCSPELLIINHLLPGSFTLGLLLLPQGLSLLLGRRHWLSYAFTSSCLIRDSFDSRLLHLLTAQLLHLLPRAPIATPCLSRQVGNLFLARLLRSKIWRLRLRLLWRRGCGAFVS
jgi:hypothetical protein